MDSFQLSVGLVKYLAWPIAIVIFTVLLKDKISGWFSGGVKSMKSGGNEIHFYEKQEVLLTEKASSDFKINVPLDTTGMRAGIVTRIKSDINKLDQSKRVDTLVEIIAYERLISDFNSIYYNIFGSQIRLLSFLAEVAENGEAPTKRITKFYNKAKRNSSEFYKDASFSDYVSFLLRWFLIENNEDSWKITKIGRAFILHLSKTNLPKDRAF